MPFRYDENGKKVEISPEELDQEYQHLMNGARKRVQQTALFEPKRLAAVHRAWNERLDFLKQRRELKQELEPQGKTALRENERFYEVLEEIMVRDTIIHSEFQNLNLFSQWVLEMTNCTDQARRAYGYAIRQAEKLGLAKLATDEEKEEIIAALQDGQRPPFLTVTYRGQWYVPTDEQDNGQRKLFHKLEGLRRVVWSKKLINKR